MKKVLIKVGYGSWLEVDLETAKTIVEAAKWERTYEYNGYQYKKVLKDDIELVFVEESELKTPEEATLNIEEIMEENNRLTRENENLRNKVEALNQPVRELIVVGE